MSKVVKGERPPCPRCGHDYTIKSGILMGKQRFLCRNCHYQFTTPKMRCKPGNLKAMAMTLYSYGVTMDKISELLNISIPSVHYWMQSFIDKKIQRPEAAKLVKIPLADLMKLLPDINAEANTPVVLVPVDENTGEVAGVINIPVQ